MTEYLLFRLYGPMASWGDIAVGEVRSSFAHPTKSAVLGLVAAAIGIDRRDEETQAALATGYGFAVKVECLGIPLLDYHTAQAPPAGSTRKMGVNPTRKDELSNLSRDDLSTILSYRSYRLDALAIAVLWAKTPTARFTLRQIADALERPKYVLFLGRKSCPPALPLEAQVVTATSIREALAMTRFNDFEPLKELRLSRPTHLYWEDGTPAGVPARHTFERRDQPRSRRRWQFEMRTEHEGVLDVE